MGEQDDDIDLVALDDDELVTQMHDDLYDGLADAILEGTTILLDRSWAPDKVLADALVEGMRIVGIDFRDGILFVPEVMLSANATKAGMEILRPLLAETGASADAFPIQRVIPWDRFDDAMLRGVDAGTARLEQVEGIRPPRFPVAAGSIFAFQEYARKARLANAET